MNLQISRGKLIILTALFVVVADNYSFFNHVIEVYPLTAKNSGFLASIVVIFWCFLIILFSLFGSKYTLKPFLIFSILTASAIAYFANTYHIIIDDTMIQNVLETNVSESADLVSSRLFIYLGLLGFFPAWLIYKAKLKSLTFRKHLSSTLLRIILSLIIIVNSPAL